MLRFNATNRPTQPRHGFTLVELLVVIAIVGVLMGLLLPAVQAAREAARRSQCLNKLKQIGLALENYHGVHKEFPAGGLIYEKPSGFSPSWRVLILPYLESGALYDQIDPQPDGGVADDSPKYSLIDAYICPSALQQDDDPKRVKHSHYAAVAGGNTDERMAPTHIFYGDIETSGIFYADSHTRIAEISDGTSNTLAIGERTYIVFDWLLGVKYSGIIPNVKWMGSSAFKNIRYPINAPGTWKLIAPADAPLKVLLNDLPFASDHPGGAHFGFADGSVHFLNETIDFTVYQGMSTKAGGEVVGELP